MIVRDVTNNCIEQRLVKKFSAPRPSYRIPCGTDCQEWTDDARADCQKQCHKNERIDYAN